MSAQPNQPRVNAYEPIITARFISFTNIDKKSKVCVPFHGIAYVTHLYQPNNKSMTMFIPMNGPAIIIADEKTEQYNKYMSYLG